MGLAEIRAKLDLTNQCGCRASQKDAEIEEMVSGLQSQWNILQRTMNQTDATYDELDNMCTAFWHSFRSVKMMLPVLVEERNETGTKLPCHKKHALIDQTALDAFFSHFKNHQVQ